MEYSIYDEWAGASSMWASCCGLLNEVMGTGAVRGQQAAFRGGTGPFRFAQSSDFPSFPSSSSSNIVCKACGLAFSVFRKKHICSDCKKDFCSVCSTLQENHRRCCTCHLLQETAFQRARLMKLKVKDLRQYLTLRNIPTDSCREKEDLVELVLCHHASSVPDEETNIGAGNPTRAQSSSFFSHPFFSAPFVPSPSVSSSQGDIPENLVGSAASSQGTSETVSVASDTEPQELSRARASLSDLSTLAEIEGLTIRQLKEILARNFVNYSGCCEKWELVDKVRRLYKETEENRKSCTLRSERTNAEKPENKINSDKEQIPLTGIDENLCRICMDAIIDCVLLECGHMVTCTKCGKRMNECPICRQYVVRAVHVFKS